MLANAIMNLLQCILPGQYWYYAIIGLAVLAAIGGVWAWMRKKNPD